MEWGEYSTWEHHKVTVLEMGPWISHVVQLEEEINASEEEKEHDDWEANRIKEQAKNLPEPTEP